MHRLFWKLFLSYWAVLVIFAAALIVSAALYIDSLRERNDDVQPRAQYAQQLAQAQAVGQREGQEGLRIWLKRADRQELVPLLILNSQGEDLLGREVSERLLAHLQRSTRRDEPDGRGRMLIHTQDGQVYRLVRDYRNVTLGRIIGRPKVLALPLVAATLGGGLICFLLARYLVSPIERLKRATQDFAAGDLDRRVAPSLGQRRDEIADLAHALDHMAGRLSHLIGSQRQLLRDISHELRSPLARVQAALDLARQRSGSADPAFDRIERETERLNELIGRILALARLDAGMSPLNLELLALEELVRDVVADAQIEAQAKDVRLHLACTTQGPLHGDPALLHSAIENVVRNALRYTAPGSEVNVTVDTDSASGHLLLRVLDQGPGVPQEQLTRIFEPFFRTDESQAVSRDGFGLGLAIATRAISLHHGHLQALNRPGGGLEIRIELPADV